MPTARSCRHSNSLFHEPLHFSRDPRAPQQAPARSSASGLMTHHTIVEHGAPGWLAVLPAVPPVAGMKAAGARDTAQPGCRGLCSRFTLLSPCRRRPGRADARL